MILIFLHDQTKTLTQLTPIFSLSGFQVFPDKSIPPSLPRNTAVDGADADDAALCTLLNVLAAGATKADEPEMADAAMMAVIFMVVFDIDRGYVDSNGNVNEVVVVFMGCCVGVSERFCEEIEFACLLELLSRELTYALKDIL